MFKYFLQLHLGLRRLIIALTIIPVIMGLGSRHEEIEAILIFSLIYWGIVLTLCWVYDGFRQKK